ncbi:MAG: M20 family metallo-hydrolase [Cyclobacteriaceae bacterium]|nr:M20 family metallo-hydrolase [Cyclobacteriaceae bacterium]
MTTADQLVSDAVALLQQLIATPSFSREEDKTAAILEAFLQSHGAIPKRKGNNVWAVGKSYDPSKPTLLLNSHHDTVKPNPGYTRDPFQPAIEGGKLFGLGSNDAGGAAVALTAAFLQLHDRPDLSHNLVLAITAEEEISGANGIESLWHDLPRIDCAIVGEPTQMDVAVSEKGLMVLDCVATGKAGHAAREEGENAIYKALADIEWFRTYVFPTTSSTLGPVKMSVTVIQAGQAHNQVPAECRFTVDVRVTDAYTLEEVLSTIRQHVASQVTPRSLRMRPSGIPDNHPLVVAARARGKKCYGSPTTSDRALIPVPSVKMGPGDSGRSHSADEYIFVEEIADGIRGYLELIQALGARR